MSQVIVLDAIQGGEYQDIQAALKVIRQHRLELAQHSVAVTQEDVIGSIVLTPMAGDKAARKSVGVRRGADVELTGRDLAAAVSQVDQGKKVTTIPGKHLQAIQAAEAVFLRRFPPADLAQYRIEVVRDGFSLVVIFTPNDLPPDALGGLPGKPGFEVELKGEDLAVVRANFLK